MRLNDLRRNSVFSRQNVILVTGIIFLAFFLHLPHSNDSYTYTYWNSLLVASDTLRGNIPVSDLAQDIIGVRALFSHTNPYPDLGIAAANLGIEWENQYSSTHLPTTFIFVAPIAFLQWHFSSALWGWLMLCGLAMSYRLYGVPWKLSIGLAPLTLLWPPAALSLGQVTILWLFFTALAYRLRFRFEFWSGFSLGLGTMVKIFPGIMLIPAFLNKQWKVIGGAIVISISFVIIILILNPASISQYLVANLTSVPFNVARCDNGAIYYSFFRLMGRNGVFLLAILSFLLLFLNRTLISKNNIQSIDTWMFMVYLSVFLLPLLWNYSLLPLLPVVIWLFQKKRSLITALCGLFFTQSSLFPMAFCESSYLTVFSLILCGAALTTSTILSKGSFQTLSH